MKLIRSLKTRLDSKKKRKSNFKKLTQKNILKIVIRPAACTRTK